MDKVAEAKRAVPAISLEEAAGLLGRKDVLFVDVRDAEETAQTGTIKGAVKVSRGMLEFRADDTTPYHNPAFTRDKKVILYCASGGRSEEHTSELQSLMRISYAVFCLKKKTNVRIHDTDTTQPPKQN